MPPLPNDTLPTNNWDAVYEIQSLDPSGNLAYKRAVANAKAEGSMSDLSGAWGSSAASGTLGGGPSGGTLYSGSGKNRGAGRDVTSEYHDYPIERVPNGSGRVRKALKALANLDDEEADELLEAIASDGRYVARLTRLAAGERATGGFDRGSMRTPQSVYGGGGPSWNTAADYLAAWPVRNEYLADVFATSPTLNSERQKQDPMPTVNWQQMYEEDSAMRDEHRPRG
jgi:hypothetical protein